MNPFLRGVLVTVIFMLDAACVADVLQGAVWSADGPILQGYMAGIVHGLALLLTFAAGVVCRPD